MRRRRHPRWFADRCAEPASHRAAPAAAQFQFPLAHSKIGRPAVACWHIGCTHAPFRRPLRLCFSVSRSRRPAHGDCIKGGRPSIHDGGRTPSPFPLRAHSGYRLPVRPSSARTASIHPITAIPATMRSPSKLALISAPLALVLALAHHHGAAAQFGDYGIPSCATACMEQAAIQGRCGLYVSPLLVLLPPSLSFMDAPLTQTPVCT